MEYSKYNIFSKIRESENYFILNLLSGNVDILDPEEAAKVESASKGLELTDNLLARVMEEKGYLVEKELEKKLFRQKYLDFIDSRDEEEVQLFFIPNYSCNFACTYCFQDQYTNPNNEISEDLIESFFSYIDSEFAGRKKYITIFGGEPLLGSPKQKKLIASLLEKSKVRNLEVCVVTNGYTLEEYIPILQAGEIREIQVTLDGTEAIHNKRRFLKGGGSTYNKIVTGISACLDNKLPLNLRMVIDRDNADDLPLMAKMAIERGWTKSPYFKAQLGRNYELHHCQSANDKLFTRISLYDKIYDLVKKYPYILEFYKPAFSITKFLQERGEMPDPLFDSCPACKTEWAFDYTGKIYPCTATVGKSEEAVGSFFPHITLNEDIISEWEKRDVTSIAECRDCTGQLACGGGCGSVAKNRTGQICSSDCRPVKELMEIGFSTYFPDKK
jgi:uncharacterized protein